MSDNMSLESIKSLVGNDDPRIDIIYNLVESRLCARIKRYIVPSELQYIVVEITLARYNRLGAEGMSSESVEGHTTTFIDDDFAQYEVELSDYVDRRRRGGISWL